MNSTVAINGSPKAKDGVSGMLISQIEAITGTAVTVYQAAKLINHESVAGILSDILKADTLLVVFPLYVDSLPAPLVKLFTLMEREAVNISGQPPTVYAVCNCGFFEAEHNQLALNMVESFCDRSGLVWGYGIGVGGGGFVQSQSKNMSKGPAANIHAALQELGGSIKCNRTGIQNIFVTPKMPLFMYKMGGNIGWLKMAGKHGKRASLMARPHIQ